MQELLSLFLLGHSPHRRLAEAQATHVASRTKFDLQIQMFRFSLGGDFVGNNKTV
jgi:hypothetical protein